MADFEIDVNVDERATDRWEDIVGDGAEDAVDQLAVLAERHMKEEAPEGVGIPEVNMRTTIKAVLQSRDPYRKSIQPHKKTDEGWPLHHAIIDGATYPDERPPVEPLKRWARAKLGDAGIGWYLQEQIFEDGQKTFPNRFVDRSVSQWESRVEDIAQDAVDDAFDTRGSI